MFDSGLDKKGWYNLLKLFAFAVITDMLYT